MERRYPLTSLDARAREFLDTLSESPQTQATYTFALKAFYSFRRFYAKSDKDAPAPLAMRAMDLNVLERFQRWLGKRYASRFTRRTYLAGVIAYLDYAIDQGWLDAHFSLDRARYRKKKSDRKRESYPIPKTPEGIARVIGYYDSLLLPAADTDAARIERLRILRGRALLLVLYSTAARISEVASLTRKAVQDGRRLEAEVIGKGNKERFVFLLPEARAAIARYVGEREDASEWLFIRHSKGYGKPLSRAMLFKIVVSAGTAVGVKLHPHDIRHYRASQMLEQGAPLEAIQEILGHSDIGTTRRVYAHYSNPTIRSIFERTTIPVAELGG